MTNFFKKLGRASVEFGRNDSGQDLVEYALMAAFVAISAGAIMPGVAVSLKDIWTKIQNPGVALVQCYADGRPIWSTVDPFICGSTPGGAVWWRVICAVLAVIFLAVIVLRHKHNPDGY